MFLSKPSYKQQAKVCLSKNLTVSTTIATTLLGLLLLAFLLQSLGGGFLIASMLDLTQFPMETGIWMADSILMGDLLTYLGFDLALPSGGLLLSFRMDPANVVIVYLVPWVLLGLFALVQSLTFLLMSPFRQGSMEQLWKMATEQEVSRRAPYGWYAKPKLMFRALGVNFVVQMTRLLVGALFLVPAFLIYFSGTQSDILLLLSMILMLLAPFVAYYCYFMVLPAQYALAQDSTISVKEALVRGFSLFKGKRKAFFRLRLSFILWNILSIFFNSMPDAYLFQYEELTCLLYLKDTQEM